MFLFLDTYNYKCKIYFAQISLLSLVPEKDLQRVNKKATFWNFTFWTVMTIFDCFGSFWHTSSAAAPLCFKFMTEVTSMGWSTSASEALLPLPEFFWWKSCASCPDWGEGEGEGCGGNTGTAEKKIFRTCSFNPYICSLCSPPSSSSPTPQSTTSSSPDCLAHPSSLWHFSLHWK